MPPMKGKMLHYSEQQINDAIDDVLRGTAVATAAKCHSVPRVTLLYKMTGRTPRKRQMGPQPMLTREQDDVLVTWITTVAKAGFPITKTELLDIGHQESRSRWFEEINNYLNENNYENILDQPERVSNLDESTFFLNTKGNKVLRVKVEKNVYQQASADEKECLMVLYGVPHELADSVPKHWGIGKSETGRRTAPLFFEFITNIFYFFLVEKKIPLHVIIFVDGYASHFTLHTSKFCEDHGIILIALLPNTNYLILPMDIAVLPVLKEAWKKKVHQWRMQYLDDQALKKIHFAPLLAETLNEYITPSILKSGFRKFGLVLWNPAAVDTSKIPTMDAGPAYRLQEDLQANECYGMDHTEQNDENNNEENEEPTEENAINIMTQTNIDQVNCESEVSQHNGHEGNGERQTLEIQSSVPDNEAENSPDFQDVTTNRMTPKQWQLYYEKKKEAAMEKGRQKQERAQARKAKQEGRESAKKLKLQENKKKIMGIKFKKISRDVSNTEEEEEWVESGSSMDDVSLDYSDSVIIDENEVGRSITSE
ncbi:hypothetical protein PR048_013689, partial [Dryococelus australis]